MWCVRAARDVLQDERESKDRSEQIFYNPADPFGFKVRRVSLEVYANY